MKNKVGEIWKETKATKREMEALKRKVDPTSAVIDDIGKKYGKYAHGITILLGFGGYVILITIDTQ